MNVGIIAITINNNEPKNLPPTISQIFNGLVNSNSKVPCFISSEKLFIVTAGIRNKNIQGDRVKNGLKSAKPESKILYSPLKIHRNNPFRIKKIEITK
jgi:hypothetical protein